eukprot:TRINITY_DN14307_c0_g2_i1.p1 TRINITY_DN14307_c0_g2~~TRINITY_DN14307_c0_g2_i1.p1  ORF type:complete len:833 (+),score=182.31 TRINITY_DN14307_c0_g2_i1:224-2500(+)
MLDDRHLPIESSLQDIAEKTCVLQQSVDRTNSMDWSKMFNIGPLLEEMQSAEASRGNLDGKLQSMEKGVSHLEAHLDSMRRDIEDQVVRRLSEMMTGSEAKLSQICGVVDQLNKAAETITSQVRKMEEQDERHFSEVSEMISGLGSQLAQPQSFTHNGNSSLVTVDLSPLLLAINHTKEEVNLDFNMVHHEIGRIQKALQIDFTESGNRGKVIRTAEGMAMVEIADEVHDHAAGKRASMAFGHDVQVKQHAAVKVRRRIREFWSQTEFMNCKEEWTQTVPQKEIKAKSKKTAFARALTKKLDDDKGGKAKAFNDAEELRRKARQALIQPQYSVFDYYHTTGNVQMIAKSALFDNITLIGVALNALWLAVDTDLNDSDLLIDAHPVFQIVENIFCTFFFVELIIRFCAFEVKSNCVKDKWFVFDFAQVFLMLMDTWVLSIVFLVLEKSSGFDMSPLKMIRSLKLLRLTRIAKLLRALPELIIIVKGIGYAARSVSVFFLLWTIIVYVVGVLLTQLFGENPRLEQYFSTVPTSMNTLLLNVIFPQQVQLINTLSREEAILWPLMVMFILVAGMTILYMLVGVLVEVMGVISTTEKEGLVIAGLARDLRNKMELLGFNLELPIQQYELEKALVQPDLAMIIKENGVDVVVLMDMLDLIYEEAEKVGGMTFENFIETVLDMRGANPATVKDVKEHLRIIKSMIKDTKASMMRDITEQINQLKADVKAIRDEVVDEDDAEAGPEVDDIMCAPGDDEQGGETLE